MSSTMNDCTFYAEATRGFVLRVLVDVLVGRLRRILFQFKEDGIFIQNRGEKKAVLYDVSFNRERFRNYKCTKPENVHVNLIHLRKLIRNIKKKDTIILFITKEEPGRLGITIRPNQRDGVMEREETVTITYVPVDNDSIEDNAPPYDRYSYPKNIDAIDFQKVKKLTTISKELTIRICGTSSISFMADQGMYDSHLKFGEDDEDDEVYEGTFASSIFVGLVKLPQMCSSVHFHAPIQKSFPMIFIRVLCDLGTINVFVKNTDQVKFEIQQATLARA